MTLRGTLTAIVWGGLALFLLASFGAGLLWYGFVAALVLQG